MTAIPASATAHTEYREVALELRALLTELDPARWRAEQAAALREHFAQIEARVQGMREGALDGAASSDDQRARWDEVAEVCAAHRSSLELPAEAQVVEASVGVEDETQDALRDAWMSFRAAAVPAYEALARALKADGIDVPSLRPTNYTRNVFHVLSALIAILAVELLPLAVPSLGTWLVVIVAGVFFASGWTMELGRIYSERVNALLMKLFSKVAHPHEAHHINSSTWYVTALFMLALTHDPVVCSVALAVLGVGDPMAAVIGKRWGRTRFANGRSLEGTAAFALFGSLAAILTISIAHPTLATTPLIVVSAAGGVSGAVCELMLKRVDDNLGIPVAAGIAAWIVSALMIA